MTVTSVEQDPEALTLTLTAQFDAPAERVWQMWADPRLLERWWGPPTYPATFVDHDLSPGGIASYYMTGPDGDRPHGWWRVITVEPARHLRFEDGFADGEGVPNHDLPTTTCSVDLTQRVDGTTSMTIETTFPSLEAMEQMSEMGMVEGITAAVSQIDQILLTAA